MTAADQPEPVDPKRARRRQIKRLVRWVVTIAVVGIVGYFFATSLAGNWDEVVAKGVTFDWRWILATLFLVAAVPLTGLCWRRIVLVLDPAATVGLLEAVSVQCLSWVLKYVPGQVGSVANKVIWAQRRGISRTLVLISFIYENVFLLLASFVPAVAILLIALGPELFGENAVTLLLPLIALIPLVLVAWRPFFHRLIAIPARRLLKQDVPASYFLSTGQTLRSIVEFVGPRILNAVGFVVLAASITDVAPEQWLVFGAAYVLGAAVGILAIFVPSGLGVREAVIVLILSQYIPTTDAIIISLVSRLLFTIGDVAIAGIYFLTRRTTPKELSA